MAGRRREYCWDYFGEKNALKDMQSNNEWMTKGVIYSVAGLELGEKNKGWHLQGYTAFRSVKSKTQLYEYVLGKGTKKKFWCKHREKPPLNASEYCKKGKEFIEVGVLPVGQGARTELTHGRESLEDGATLRDIIQENKLQLIYYSKIWLDHFEEKRDFKPEVWWLWGVSGAGKTHRAKALTEGKDAYWVSRPQIGQKLWFCGYDKHEWLVIDDYRQSHISLPMLIDILGDAPVKLQTKGSSRQLLARNIIITTNKSPEKMYRNADEEIYQLTRRIEHTEHFDQRFVNKSG